MVFQENNVIQKQILRRFSSPIKNRNQSSFGSASFPRKETPGRMTLH